MQSPPELPHRVAAQDGDGTVPFPIPLHAARDLTAGGPKACILLDGAAHELRITRAGKLILTK